MLFLRRFLSLVLVVIALGCGGVFIAASTVRSWGEEYEVSQVFKLLKAIPLGRQNYIGFYDTALTPDDPKKLVELCQVVTVTPSRYLNLLDKKAWLLPMDPPRYAYCETPDSRFFMDVILGCGILLLVLAYLMARKKEE
jgi:hypothetical protein